MRKQSSLFERTRPTSVTPPHTISTLAPVACLNSHPYLCACSHASTPKGLRKALNPTDYSHLSHTRAPGNCPVLCDLRGLPDGKYHCPTHACNSFESPRLAKSGSSHFL